MKRRLPWMLVALLLAFFVFQAIGYEDKRNQAEQLGTIEGQAALLKEWLELDEEQARAYVQFRNDIVAKEAEFAQYRKADAKAFFESDLDTIPNDEKLSILKDRHLTKLKEIKNEELDLWSNWIDTLSFEQRRKYVGKVFEHRPLDTSWFDRDFFDDIRGSQ